MQRVTPYRSIAVAIAELFGVAVTTFAADFTPVDLKPKTGLKPFEYVSAEAELPNYVAGAKWGTQGEAIRTMQRPVSPAESQQHIVLPPGFEAKLFASEPDILKPICMAWDQRGRLWIGETVDYPNALQEPGHGHDRIKICEDTNGDGRADKFIVFAEKLSIPTGMVFANGGLIVIEAGHTLFLKDTNGDDKADERRVLFSGWGVNDTHATASNLRWGFDNWIWGVVGYSGFNGEVGGQRVRFGMGVYRFKPDGSAIEFVRSSNNNTWGLGLSEEGIIFGSTANNNASWYMAIPNRYYESVNGWSASRMETIADSQNIYPITDKVRQVDWHGRYTAGAGHALYTARAFPKSFWNRIAFVAEPTGHLIGHFALEARGADFVAHNLHDFLASDDEWCAPITAEVGPDGAVWVSDWYNYVVQHNPTPIGFKTGRGNAYETPLRDKTHGRIYRIVYNGSSSAAAPPNRAQATPPRLDPATPQQLVAALKNDDLLWRMHAQRLLVERGKKDVVPALVALVNDNSVDEIGLNTAAIHALCTLHGLGATDEETVAEALKHHSAGVRRIAATVCPRTEAGARKLLASGVLEDSDAQVRLAALLALADCPGPNTIAEAAYAAIRHPQNAGDRWLRDAATSAGVRHRDGFLHALLADTRPLPAGAADVIRVIARDYASRLPADLVKTLSLLPKTSASSADALLDGLAAGWPRESALELSAADRAALENVMQQLPDTARERLLALGQRWKTPGLFAGQIASITEKLHARIANSQLDEETRLSAAKNLVRLADQTGTAQLLVEQINLQSSPAFAADLIAALGESRQPETGRGLLAQWKRFTPATRRASTVTLLRRPEWTAALLDAIEQKEIQRTDLSPEHWQQLERNRDNTIAARARKLSASGPTLSADREELVKKLLPVAQQKGDPVRGKEVFKTACVVCHKFNGEGASIGPELTGIGAKPRADILTDILDPNRSVEANYRLWTVTTKADDTFAGRLEAETQTSIEILDLTSVKQTIDRKDIARLDGSSLSIMPVGFESLPESDLASLLEYLTGGSKLPVK
jgi:hypothetical protein